MSIESDHTPDTTLDHKGVTLQRSARDETEAPVRKSDSGMKPFPPKPKRRDIIIGVPYEPDEEERGWIAKGKDLLEKGIELMRQGRHEESAILIREAIPWLEAGCELEVIATGYHHLALIYHFAGKPAKGIEPMEKAVDHRRYLTHPMPLMTSLCCLSVLYRKAGSIARAVSSAEEAIDLARRARAQPMLALGLVARARALMVDGEFQDFAGAARGFEEVLSIMDAYDKPIPSIDRAEIEVELFAARYGMNKGQ